MGQKAYPTSLRFTRSNSFPRIQLFARTPVWFQNYQIGKLWKHLRARTPVYKRDEFFLLTPNGIDSFFHVAGWHTQSEYRTKSTPKGGATPWYRERGREKVYQKRRSIVVRKIKGLPSFILGTTLKSLSIFPRRLKGREVKRQKDLRKKSKMNCGFTPLTSTLSKSSKIGKMILCKIQPKIKSRIQFEEKKRISFPSSTFPLFKKGKKGENRNRAYNPPIQGGKVVDGSPRKKKR